MIKLGIYMTDVTVVSYASPTAIILKLCKNITLNSLSILGGKPEKI